MKHIIISVVIGAVLTAVSYLVGIHFLWITEVNWLEVFSVFTAYACTYLCVQQSRNNYFFGIVSVAALSLLFYQAELFSSMALNIYLFPTLVYGYFFWRPDDNTRPVTSIQDYSSLWVGAFAALVAATYGIVILVSSYFGAMLPFADSAILVLSIAAQFLLDRKIKETWLVWITVNIISIPVYISAGLPLVAFQYVFFLFNAFWGFSMWNKSQRRVAHG